MGRLDNVELMMRNGEVLNDGVNPYTEQTTYEYTAVGSRYLIRDRDPLYTKDFDAMVEASGTHIIKISPCAPDMNAYAERFVQTLKHECLNKMIFTSQAQLEYAVSEFMIY